MAEHPNKHIREAIKYALKKSLAPAQGRPARSRLGTVILSLRPSRRLYHPGLFVTKKSGKPRSQDSRRSRSLSPCVKPGSKERPMKRKKTYGFSVVLTAATLSAEECDALYEAGCDDGTIVTRNKVTFIAFDRKAASLEQAIRSATADVRAAGFEVKRVEMPALV
jgi:hypothetical protein